MNAIPNPLTTESASTPDTLYTPLDCAVRELRRRREDGKLGGTPTNGTLSHAITDLLQDRPHAVMFRQIATPNYEISRFVCVAREHGLQPLIMEFHDDRFLTMNPLKCALVRMRFSMASQMSQKSHARFAALQTCKSQMAADYLVFIPDGISP